MDGTHILYIPPIGDNLGRYRNHKNKSLTQSVLGVVERAFGVVKKRFPILKSMTNYDYDDQVRLVKACFMVHSFIRLNQGYKDEYDQWDENNEGDNEGNYDNDEGGENLKMLTSYESELQRRGRK